MLAVLAAIDALAPATLVKLAERTGIDKKTVTNLIEQAREQAGVIVVKSGTQYSIEEWGPIIKKTGAKMCLTGAFNAPSM
ncbi:hypothetical protein GTP90_00765 [Rugamonas sp. FT81W]|uniref:Helix-turn-helix type 11 domain-containing protein n=2 Tax=Duganella vulcania TaxID=2692166 RepID=A0A845GGK9_9BURK|nr:hypothetical protein [Duganella vulcania]